MTILRPKGGWELCHQSNEQHTTAVQRIDHLDLRLRGASSYDNRQLRQSVDFSISHGVQLLSSHTGGIPVLSSEDANRPGNENSGSSLNT